MTDTIRTTPAGFRDPIHAEIAAWRAWKAPVDLDTKEEQDHHSDGPASTAASSETPDTAPQPEESNE